jgi:hypothetical protein
MHNTLSRLIAGAAIAACLCAPAAAATKVRYDFTAFSSLAWGEPEPETFSGSFSVVTTGFVTSPTVFPQSALLSCTVIADPPATASCRDQEFLFAVLPDTVTVNFGVSTETNPGLGIYYYFEANAFSTPGTHDSTVLGSAQAGRLVVTAVPEPATAASLLFGLAALGAWRRRAARAA